MTGVPKGTFLSGKEGSEENVPHIDDPSERGSDSRMNVFAIVSLALE